MRSLLRNNALPLISSRPVLPAPLPNDAEGHEEGYGSVTLAAGEDVLGPDV